MTRILFLPLFGIIAACAPINTTLDNVFLGDNTYISKISTSMSHRGDKVVANISGQTYEDNELFYNVIWFDCNGTKIDTILSKSIQSRVRREQSFHWTAIAPSAEACSYEVHISARPIQQ